MKPNLKIFKNMLFYYFSYLSYLVVFVGLIDIKSATITDKGQISISKTLRGKKGFSEGSKIAILNYDDHVEIRRMDEIEERFGTAFASEKSLAKLWNNKEEDKRWKNL
ncbi:MAG: AbrB/MazE/SpoVT family DNA-binding domain-containing protein [archaeon]